MNKNFINLHILFLFYSFVIVISKLASHYQFLSFSFIMLFGLGLIMMAIYAFFWQQIIKKFTLVAAYSNKGVVILWTLIWAFLFYGEEIKLNHFLGTVIIIIGIILVTSNSYIYNKVMKND